MAILINDNSARVQYTATAGQTVFTVPFEFFENGNLVVYNGSTVLTYAGSPANASQYSATGAGVTGGGSITLGSPGASLGDIITIVRDLPIERTSDFPLSGPFNIDGLNTTLDKMTAMLQGLQTNLEQRVPRLADSDAPDSLNSLPVRSSRTNKVFYWDSAGQPSALDPSALGGSIAFGSVVVNSFTGNGSTTTFTLSENPVSINNLIVTVNGVTKTPTTDYTISGATTLLFASAPANGATILVRFARALSYNLYETGEGSGLIGYGSDRAYNDGTVGNELVPRVTRSLLPGVSPKVGKIAFMQDSGREGHFICRAGTAPSDPLQGIYVPSSTSGFYWERVYSGFPRAEWWGAVLNNSGVDSAAALQASIDVTGKLYFPKGLYYGSVGLNGNGAVLRGDGELFAGYACSSPTDHLLSNVGTTSAFATGLDAEGFTLARTVTPTTPAFSANDISQGHGIHLDLASNPRIKNVYTYNNLVELYHSRCLSPEIDGVRGLRQTGGSSDRWVGYWVNGDPTGMPGGWATGPSGNPSARIGKLNMVANGSVGTEGSANLSRNYVLQNHLQDLWIEHAEAGGGGHIQFDINANNYPCSDAYIANAIADGFTNKGFHIRNMPINSTFAVKKAWIAPSAAAASASSPYGLRAEGAHGLTFNAAGDFTSASAIDGVYSTDANNQDIEVRFTNCQRPIYTISVSTSRLNVFGICTLNGTSAGQLMTVIGGGGNELSAGGLATGTKKWSDGIALDGSSANNRIDVSRVAAAAISGSRHTVAGLAVTTQGNVNGHVVINPGAGAML